MDNSFNPRANYEATKKKALYVERHKATQETYDRIGFMSGLEVHQQLLTKEKLFCHCPAGIYNSHNDYDAEIVRHMRPTLSELGEYDGTALMEFKTRKNIIYRIKNETACTYEVDDTPPFQINREALNIAIEISLLSKLNIVGEVHITRKQYLDGSIPTGFQRTAIIGVEGEIQLRNKKVRLIQLSIEEDSCREISDVGHVRVYKTDRLGMPLIETVTYPDCTNPEEVREACNYIRFLNRSTNKVRTGMGAGRQDVNVSCKGGTRVEIKGVAHTKWIPELTHNEAFRQWCLLLIRDELLMRFGKKTVWKIEHQHINPSEFNFNHQPLLSALVQKQELLLVKLQGFKGILSHFTQPGQCFANEISDRLKVIACLEKPNMVHSESFESELSQNDWEKLHKLAKADKDDALMLFWAQEEDIKTALETIEERCQMAFEGVPNETRKSLPDGTTIFERVLPGADRMYPDTDSAPIPLKDEEIERMRSHIPEDIIDRYHQLKKWGAPEDTYTYIFSKNLFPLIQSIVNQLAVDPVYCTTFFGHKLKFIEGQIKPTTTFAYKTIYALFRFLNQKGLKHQLAERILPFIYQYPNMEFESVLTNMKFKSIAKDDILARIPFLKEKFMESAPPEKHHLAKDWVMGQLRKIALGNISLTELHTYIKNSK
jgi:glutamyl-tRNA(Gln) amidotransferase subunit E